MITVFSGIPGSGKTYKMVAELDRQKDEFFVAHNIEGLDEDYLGEFGVHWPSYCEKESIPLDVFFSKDFQIEYCAKVQEKYKRQVLVIIDESQEWFDRIKRNSKMWLSYHRHLGQEIWVVSHRRQSLPLVYQSYIEVEYRAKGGKFISLPGFFAYNRIVGGTRSGYTFERKKERIFCLYKSVCAGAKISKKKSAMLPLLVVGVVVLVGSFIYIPSRMWGSKVAAAPVKVASAGVSGSAVNMSVVNNGGSQNEFKSISVVEDVGERYAYVGAFENAVVLESRKTGQNILMELLPEKLMLIEVSRSGWCRALSALTGKEVMFINSGRYYDRKDVSSGHGFQSSGLSINR